MFDVDRYLEVDGDVDLDPSVDLGFDLSVQPETTCKVDGGVNLNVAVNV